MIGRGDGGLGPNEAQLVQDVRIGMGEYEAHCLRCLLLGSVPRLPFHAQKNELVAAWARSRNIQLPADAPSSSPSSQP
jgi:hypothetical protein